MNKLLVIVGPTGVGKTETCLRVAEMLKIPIINADSRQIYAELPIGTAAPTEEQQRRVKHYFVGTLHLNDYYSASLYENDVMNLLENELFRHNEVALMSGGSMMYIDAVCDGIDEIPTIDNDTRAMMKKQYEEKGLDKLCAELKLLDPEYYEIVDRKNPKRVVHALEICYMTGKTYTSFRKKAKKQRPFEIIKIGLNREREEIYDRINRRVLTMMDEGLEKEARSVYPLKELNALNTVGYKEMFAYFDGEKTYEGEVLTLDDAIERIQSDTRRYCRKQQTWFKKDGSIRWFHPDQYNEIAEYINSKI